MLEKKLCIMASYPWKRLNSYQKFKKGFTLAEVLITLSIIGVVAAMTMPSVIANHKTSVRNQQFKKAYSTITNAFNLVQSEAGQFPNCYFRAGIGSEGAHFTECDKMWDLVASKLNVVKVCKGSGFADGCLPEYNLPDEAACPLYTKANINNRSYVYVLNSGAIIYTYGSNPISRPYFRMDINGKKGPNWGGHDVFTFHISDQGTSIPRVMPDSCGYSENNGVSATKMLQGVAYQQ